MSKLRIEKNTAAALLLGMTGILLGTPFYVIKIPLQTGSFMILFQTGMTGNIMEFMLPVIAVFSGGSIFLREYESGFIKFSISRIGRMTYIWEKTVFSCLGTGITFFLSGILVFTAYFLFLFPMELKGALEVEKILECCFILLRLSITAGILSGLSGIFGALFLNFYMSYGLPFVCYYMMIILKERYLPEFYSLYPPEWVSPKQNWGNGNSGLWYLLFILLLLVILLYALILKYRLKEIS